MSDAELSSETTTTAKRGRGRPKKDLSQNNGGIDTVKNGTGAPKEAKKRAPKAASAKSGPSKAKRGRGRPKTKTSGAAVKKGGKRGRPKKTESVEEEAAPLDGEASASAEEEEEED